MKHEHPLRKQYTAVRLTDAERASMRAAVHAHIHPSIQGSIRSPFRSFMYAATRPVAALLVVSCIGVTTSGVTYASQSALPDEALYPVKMFAEHVETLFAQTSHARVQTAGAHALRRIQEATRMHLEKRMTAEHEQQLSESVREELVRISHVVATQDTDTSTARESAVVLAKVVGYTNVLNQTVSDELSEAQELSFAKATTGVTAEAGHSSPLVDQIEFFVDTHEDAIADAVSNDADIVAEHFIGEIGENLLAETPDPLVEATVAAVISSERIMDMFPSEKGERVLHALADMAEGSASVEAFNAHAAVDSDHLQNI